MNLLQYKIEISSALILALPQDPTPIRLPSSLRG